MRKISSIIGMCILTFLFLGAVTTSSTAFAAANYAVPTENGGDSTYWTDQVVTKTITEMMQRNNVPGMSVALYINGKPYLFHYGYANLLTRQPVTSNTIFEMGSITKTFTSLLLSMEIVDGRMHLHDSVMRYASALQRIGGAVNGVTLEQLATHTSSLPFELPDYISTEQSFCNYLNRWHPVRPIGSTWQYSNVGFGLLGYMLEGATNETFDQLLHERILNPLGMNHTAINVPFEMQNDYAQGYNAVDFPAKQWRHNDIIPAEGSLKTTSQDMLKYLMASLGVVGTPEDMLAAQHLACTSFVATRYGLQGLAWEKHPLVTLNDLGYVNRTRVLFIKNSRVSAVPPNDPVYQNDDMLVDKTGNTAGFTSYMAIIPSHKMGIVLLANRAALREQIGLAGRVILLNLMRTEPSIQTIEPVFPAQNTSVINQSVTNHVATKIVFQPITNSPAINQNGQPAAANQQSNVNANIQFENNSAQSAMNSTGHVISSSSTSTAGNAVSAGTVTTTVTTNSNQQPVNPANLLAANNTNSATNSANAVVPINPANNAAVANSSQPAGSPSVLANGQISTVHKLRHPVRKHHKKIKHKTVVHKSTGYKKTIHHTVKHHHVINKKTTHHKVTVKKHVATTN